MCACVRACWGSEGHCQASCCDSTRTKDQIQILGFKFGPHDIGHFEFKHAARFLQDAEPQGRDSLQHSKPQLRFKNMTRNAKVFTHLLQSVGPVGQKPLRARTCACVRGYAHTCLFVFGGEGWITHARARTHTRAHMHTHIHTHSH